MYQKDQKDQLDIYSKTAQDRGQKDNYINSFSNVEPGLKFIAGQGRFDLSIFFK